MWRGQEGEEPDMCGTLVRLAGQPPPFENSRGREMWRPSEKGKRAGAAAAVFRPLSRRLSPYRVVAVEFLSADVSGGT
ncbi:hypothetical protein cypCar_00017752 [Cyprinus carpio]|nr:hypothetical protein cypCar_00017752 [Cyprinus carpio]